jgi:hypothetical protein
MGQLDDARLGQRFGEMGDQSSILGQRTFFGNWDKTPDASSPTANDPATSKVGLRGQFFKNGFLRLQESWPLPKVGG